MMSLTWTQIAANRRAADVSPLHAVGVSQVMSLSSLLVVEENDDGGDEVDDLSGGKQVDVGSAVSATVTVPAGGQGSTWGSTEDLLIYGDLPGSTEDLPIYTDLLYWIYRSMGIY